MLENLGNIIRNSVLNNVNIGNGNTIIGGSNTNITSINGKDYTKEALSDDKSDKDYTFTGNITIEIHGNCGNINTTGNVNVDGSCNDIDTNGNVNVGGNVNGDIDTNGSVTVGGSVDGNIETMGRVIIGSH